MARILVVDDDPETLRILDELLSGAGHSVVQALDGRAATSLCSKGPPDLAIIDIYMPNKDGLETIMELRRDYPSTRIVAISGRVAKKNLFSAAVKLGAARTILKPFLPEEILKVVDELTLPS